MKKYFAVLLIAGIHASALAQTNEMELVKKQLLDLHENVRRMEARHQEEMQSLQQKIQEQQTMINRLQSTSAPAALAGPVGTGAASPAPVVTLPAPAAQPWTPADPIRIAGHSKNYLNLSFDGLFAAAGSSAPDLQNVEIGGHDPNQRGFTVQNLELTLDGAVDPYFNGQASLVTQIDRTGNTTFEAEEAWLETTSLPANLQLKGGLFLSPFGRINQTHPHTWEFADQPLVNGRFFGPDGLRNPGAQISCLTPLPWYSELLLAVQNGSGSTAFSFRNRGDGDTFLARSTIERNVRGPADLLYVPRWVNSFDLTDEQTVVLGSSAAFGPNDTGGTSSTQIYGVDAFYKWKPAHASGGWPFVKWQAEGMYRRFEAGDASNSTLLLPVETFHDWGAYSQVSWGFSKGWVAALRGDCLHLQASAFTSDDSRTDRWRVSPNLTWYPTEFSKIRLQYDHDELASTPLRGARNVETIILQFEFLLGAHGAHKF